MLQANFQASNAFVTADVRKPTLTDPNYSVNVSIRDYGQMTLTIPTSLVTPVQANLLNDGELGYPLSQYLDSAAVGMKVTGQFSRFRKSPTSAVSLAFVVSSIVQSAP